MEASLWTRTCRYQRLLAVYVSSRTITYTAAAGRESNGILVAGFSSPFLKPNDQLSSSCFERCGPESAVLSAGQGRLIHASFMAEINSGLAENKAPGAWAGV